MILCANSTSKKSLPACISATISVSYYFVNICTSTPNLCSLLGCVLKFDKNSFEILVRKLFASDINVYTKQYMNSEGVKTSVPKSKH